MVNKATGQHGLTSSNVVAIAPMTRSMKKMKTNTRNNNVRLIREPSAQKDLVQQTYRHLCERCFPSIFWLRTPSGMEFNKFNTDASKRYLQRETTEVPTKCYQRKSCDKPGTIHDEQFQNITDHQRIPARFVLLSCPSGRWVLNTFQNMGSRQLPGTMLERFSVEGMF